MISCEHGAHGLHIAGIAANFLKHQWTMNITWYHLIPLKKVSQQSKDIQSAWCIMMPEDKSLCLATSLLINNSLSLSIWPKLTLQLNQLRIHLSWTRKLLMAQASQPMVQQVSTATPQVEQVPDGSSIPEHHTVGDTAAFPSKIIFNFSWKIPRVTKYNIV